MTEDLITASAIPATFLRNAHPVIGIFGAGEFRVAFAHLALDAGYTVHIASSGSATDTALLTRFFAPDAVPATVQDLAAHADILVIAVPLRRFRELPLAAMGNHIVIDVKNYWRPIDGVYHQMDELSRPAGSPDRAALAVAGDDPNAIETVAHLIDNLGFDPIPAGTLADSGALEPDSAVFGQHLNQHQMRRALGIARAA